MATHFILHSFTPWMKRFLPSAIYVLLSVFSLAAQTVPPGTASSGKGDTTSYLSYKAIGFIHAATTSGEIDTLNGNVRIVQDSLFMRCDRAVIRDRRVAVAVDNVVIIHQDSIHIFADSLIYNGQTKVAKLFGEVILRDGSRTLHTTSLIYHADDKIGNYKNGGTLLDGADSRLISRIGYYDVNAGTASFKKHVVYTDSLKRLTTDSLVYNYRRERLYIVSPTRIEQDTTVLKSNSGIYDIGTDKAVLSDQVEIEMGTKRIFSGLLMYDGDDGTYQFMVQPRFEDGPVNAKADTILYLSKTAMVHLEGNALYQKGEEMVKAGSILYNEDNGSYTTLGRSDVSQQQRRLEADEIIKDQQGKITGVGQVVMRDTLKGLTIWCDQFTMDDSTEVVKAFGRYARPLMSYRLDTSFMLLRADTLVSYSKVSEGDTIDYFSAYPYVEFVKSGIGGRSDSLSYNSQDSTFILYNQSYLWSDSTQMSADTIAIFIRGGSIHQVELKNNAFVINQSSMAHFNQIKGQHMLQWFEEDRLRRAEAEGNTEMVYFMKDGQGKYQGINVSRSSSMTFQFKDDEIEAVRFYKNPESNVHEYRSGLDLGVFQLVGFDWSIENKPVIVILTNM